MSIFKKKPTITPEQKELEARITINQALKKMKKQSETFDAYKRSYVAKYQKALQINDKEGVSLARAALKQCVAKKRTLEQMIIHFELAMEQNEMRKTIGEFATGMTVIAGQMNELVGGDKFKEAASEYNRAMATAQAQTAMLDQFLADATASFDAIGDDVSGISDTEIDDMIATLSMSPEDSRAFDSQMAAAQGMLTGN